MKMTSYPASESSSARGTPRNVTSGPNIPRTTSSEPSGSPAMSFLLDHETGRCLAPYRYAAAAGSLLSAGHGRVGRLRPGRGLVRTESVPPGPRQQPVQPGRQPPVGFAEQFHYGRDQNQPDQGGVDQNRCGQAEPDLLDRDVRGEVEGQEHHPHDGRGGRDDPGGGGQAAPDRQPVVAAPVVLLADLRQQEHLVIQI